MTLFPERRLQGKGDRQVLHRLYKVVAFDWDGTAVMSRQEDATAVRLRLEKLLALEARVVIITGTNFQNIDRQATSQILCPNKRDLYVCTNRGSEVYSFDAASRPRLIWRRLATAEENRQLTGVAERVRTWVEQHGIEIDIVYDRLNRRKIDLIPVPEWRDPPKSQIGELLLAVERRLKGAGIKGGIREVLAVTQEAARAEGMADPRVTSDVKHIEVGLTDKGDSVDWMMRNVVGKGGLSGSDVLVVGDEFGPVDGFPGSDSLMLKPALKEAVIVSVGKEPNGVPVEVIHLGGGPACFRQILEWQIERHEPESAPAEEAPPEDDWKLVEQGFNPAREHEIESIFSVGNGYLGTRGSLSELPAISRPATFIAGVFQVPTEPYAVPDLVKAPDWARLRVFVDGQELNLEKGELLDHGRTLDLKRGILLREWRHQDNVGRVTRLKFIRFASLADPHALVESLSLTPENYGGTVAVESAIDGTITRQPGVEYLPPGQVSDPAVIALCTTGTCVELAFTMATILRPPIADAVEAEPVRTDNTLVHRWEWPAEMGHEYHVDKLVSAFTSCDGDDPQRATTEHLARLKVQGLTALREAHERAWRERWQKADVEIWGNASDQRALRFASYHLISAAKLGDDRVSIGARGLTGESYKGHVFWDTEIFMLPFFTFTDPETARSLLKYRHRTLPASRERAQRMGYRGALYAWESTSSGEDVTPSVVFTPSGQMIEILCGKMEHHISADVAYAVWQYWRATGDDRFLREAGAEIMFETARFWASRGQVEADGKYHIRRVIGPDEYHEGVDDNAFTNIVAQWNMEQASAIADLVRTRWPDRWEALAAQTGLDASEVEHWRDIAQRVYSGFDPDRQLFEQFAGYFDLEYIDLASLEPRTAPADVILGRERTQNSQVIKQADVVMLLHLLWDRFPREVCEKNFYYYEKRCDHGSSLSPAIHAVVAARLGDVGTAERYFRQATEIDLSNNMGNAAGGVHMAAQGGVWQAVAFGYAGMRVLDDGLSFDLHLPPSWERLAMPVHWRGRRVRLVGDRERGEVRLESGERMIVALDGTGPQVIEPGRPTVKAEWRQGQQ